MTARDWVVDKLLNDSSGRLDRPTWAITLIGSHAFTVRRPAFPDSYVYCPEGADTLFTTPDLDQVADEFPAVEFVVLLRRRAANSVYPYAYKRGIAVGRLGELRYALEASRDISKFVDRERSYVETRLDTNRSVQMWLRVGENAYRITRAALTPTELTIATFDEYEATADQVHSLMEQYSDLDLDALVATNPSTSSFAEPARRAAVNAGVKIMIMHQFMTALGRSWDE